MSLSFSHCICSLSFLLLQLIIFAVVENANAFQRRHAVANSAHKKVVLARVFIFEASQNPETAALKSIGIVDIAEGISGTTMLNGSVKGLAPGDHGFHFHQFGDISNACMAAGAHFNPHGKRHGGPTAAERHVGDLGNLVANADGVAVVDISDHLVALNGVNSVVGRALVVHEKGDDMGLGGNEESAKTGNSGKRVACGVVGVLKEQ